MNERLGRVESGMQCKVTSGTFRRGYRVRWGFIRPQVYEGAIWPWRRIADAHCLLRARSKETQARGLECKICKHSRDRLAIPTQSHGCASIPKFPTQRHFLLVHPAQSLCSSSPIPHSKLSESLGILLTPGICTRSRMGSAGVSNSVWG